LCARPLSLSFSLRSPQRAHTVSWFFRPILCRRLGAPPISRFSVRPLKSEINAAAARVLHGNNERRGRCGAACTYTRGRKYTLRERSLAQHKTERATAAELERTGEQATHMSSSGRERAWCVYFIDPAALIA